jgi:hypothetical protein
MPIRARFKLSSATSPGLPHPSPSARPSVPPISNRHWMRLEIAVTPTTHSPEPISNRHKNTLLRASWDTWGRHSRLRNAAHTPLNCAPIASASRACTGAPACARSALDCGRSATALHIAAPPPSHHAPSGQVRPSTWCAHSCLRNAAHTTRTVLTPPRPTSSSRGRFIGRRISLRVKFGSTCALFAAPVATQLIISNRSACRLETHLTPILTTKVHVLIDTNAGTHHAHPHPPGLRRIAKMSLRNSSRTTNEPLRGFSGQKPPFASQAQIQ